MIPLTKALLEEATTHEHLVASLTKKQRLRWGCQWSKKIDPVVVVVASFEARILH